MKKIISIFVLLAVCAFAMPSELSAQTETNRDESGAIVRGSYLTNDFWDNWFIEGGVGAGIYIGGHNRDFGKRIRPTFEIGFGKWITPSIGVRAAFNLAPKFTQYPYAVENKFYYYNAHADFMWNLMNAIGGYKSDRVYSLIPYVGAGYSQIGDDQMGGKQFFSGVSHAFALDAGIINKFRVSRVVDLNLEIRGTAATHTHDRIANKHTTIDCPLQVLGSITFNLGGKRFIRATTYANDAVNAAVAGAVASRDAELAALKAEKDRLAAENAKLNEELQRQIKEAQEAAAKMNKNGEFPPESFVFFNLNKSTLDMKEDAHFPAFVYYVKESIKAGKKVVLVGSADKKTGSAQTNMRLSQKRVDKVKKMLVEEYGVPADQLETVAEGSTNNRFEKNDLNRCVYVKF